MNTDLNSYIASKPEISGGRPCIQGTRVSVHNIVSWYKKGFSPEEIANEYKHLKLSQIYAALAFYHANQTQIEKELLDEDKEYDRLAQEHNNQRKSA